MSFDRFKTFLCCFELTMATDQNIKNKTLASEINTAYDKYGTLVGTFTFSLQNIQESHYWGICLQLTESSMDN